MGCCGGPTVVNEKQNKDSIEPKTVKTAESSLCFTQESAFEEAIAYHCFSEQVTRSSQIETKSSIKTILANRYQIVKPIGSGGFGQTFLAQDIYLPNHPLCVVKKLKPLKEELIPKARSLFEREAQTLQKLGQHERIPRLFAYFEQERDFYIVEEYFEGNNLCEDLHAGKKFSETEVIAFLEEMLSILDYVHKQNVIHRDIKPSNLIKCDRDGKLVLIDFGAVKEINTQLSDDRTGAISSPGYTPLEQLQGYPNYSSDIYALGMTAIEILTGVRPKALPIDMKTDRLLWRHLAQVSDRTADILDKTISPNWRDRYQSVDEVLEDLKNLTSFGVTKKLNSKYSPTPFLIEVGVVLALGLATGIYALTQIWGPSQSTSEPTRNVSENFALRDTIQTPTGEPWSLAISPNGQILANGSDNKTIELYDLKTRQLLRTLSGHTDAIRSVVFSPDNNTLVSSSGNNTIKVWDVQTGQLKQDLIGHNGTVWSLAISPDGKTLISGGEDQKIKLWNLETGELRQILSEHSARVFSLAFTPNGEKFISASADKTIKIWNFQTGELLQTLEGHTDAVRAIALSSDGKYIVSASWDTTLKVWELQSGKLIHTFKEHTHRVVSVAIISYGSNQNIVASGGVDNSIKLWNLQEGTLIDTLANHSYWILSLTTSPTERLLVSGSKDRTIKLWK
jgi:serine/threonine protein kinase